MLHDRKEIRLSASVLALFAVSAFLQLYPLGLHPARGVNDTQDCLLNAWILHWGGQQLFKDPLRLFQANIFYPNAQTLSYSEHLLPLTVLALPVSLLTSNPILAYNFVFFLCCLLNAYTMYLLVRHLTRDYLAGIVAGLIFAFSATLMQQITHLQLVTAWFIPLAFLYLHKFFEDGRLKHSVLFALCLTLQALACIYYGLFFLSVLVVVLPLGLAMNAEKIKARFLGRLILPLLPAGAVMFLFSLPYLWLFRHFRFERPLAAGAEIQNYLAVPPHNVLLAGLLHRLGSYEYFLFPGIGASVLALYVLAKKRSWFRTLPRNIRIFLAVLASICALLLLVILLSGGTRLNLGIITLSARNPARPAFALLMVLAAGFLASRILFLIKKRRQAPEPAKQANLYLWIFGWALFLSFGSGFAIFGNSPFNQRFHGNLFSPFQWFYDNVPGFKGIRVPARYSVFVLLAVAVLAGFGWQALSERLRTRKAKVLACALLVVGLNAEFLAVPQKLELVPVGKDIPPTYRWLKDQPGDFAILEVPQYSWLPNESIYMYFSQFHGKRLVNGYSGFIPYSAEYTRAVLQDFPSHGATDILQKFKVRYVILHAKVLRTRPWVDVENRVALCLEYSLKLVQTFRYGFAKPNSLEANFGEDYVFEVLPPEPMPLPPPRETVELPPDRWTARADLQPGLISLLKDGSLSTAWTTGRGKHNEDAINIVLDEPRAVDRIEIPMASFVHDWAINIEPNLSEDGNQWWVGYPGYSPGEYAWDLIERPYRSVQIIRFWGQKVRYLKIVILGRAHENYWTIPEIRIFVVKD